MMPLKRESSKNPLVTASTPQGHKEVGSDTEVTWSFDLIDYRAYRCHAWSLLWSVQSHTECEPQTTTPGEPRE